MNTGKAALLLLLIGTMNCAVGGGAAAATDATNNVVGVTERARPEYDPKGIDLGGFTFYPELDVYGTYDDNVFRRDNAVSDYYVTIAPTMRLQSNWGRHFLELYSGLTRYQYMDYSAGSLYDWNAGIDGRYDISHAATFMANAYYGSFHELWDSPSSMGAVQKRPNEYMQGHVDAAWSYQPARLGIVFGGSVDNLHWTRTPLNNGTFLDNHDRNETEYQGYGKVVYLFSPGYQAFLRTTYDLRQFDDYFDRSGFHRDSNGVRFDGGLDLQITHLLSGEVYAGYMRQDFSQDVPKPLSDISGLNYGVGLDWYVSPILTLHLNGKRELNDVIIDNASIADNRSVTVSADYELLRNVLVHGYAGYVNSKLIGISRSDEYLSAGLGAKYLINRYLSADVNYSYNDRSTNVVGYGYDDNAISAGLSLHI